MASLADTSLADKGRALLVALMRGMIRCYQLVIAPILPPSCRYWPSCSHYAAEAIAVHGPWRGLGLAGWRLLRCNPWGGSGYDPVPPARSVVPGQLAQGRGRLGDGNKCAP